MTKKKGGEDVYQREFEFLKECLRKCRIASQEISASEIADQLKEPSREDSFSEQYKRYWLWERLLQAKKNTIYRFSDTFGCQYLFFILPFHEQKTFFVIGPFFFEEKNDEVLLSEVRKAGLPTKIVEVLREFYAGVPLLGDTTVLLAVLGAFCDQIFDGSEHYSVVELNQESLPPYIPTVEEEKIKESFEQRRHQMEQRYYYENQLIDAVRHGLTHKAVLMFNGFSMLSFEKRLADPVRNLKNYCIIMNTLCRKAAEEGGVHPLFLDRISSDFAKRIEQKRNMEEIHKLMHEMFRSYCRLVQQNSLQQYSKPVQLAILQIEDDLATELNLSSLATAQALSPSYLSALFKKETGQTITDYINTKRMKLAKEMLKNSGLQIQNIAQQCGILDAQYFARLFKKYTGQTPREYRGK